MTRQPEPPESSPAAPEGEGPDADEARGPVGVPAHLASQLAPAGDQTPGQAGSGRAPARRRRGGLQLAAFVALLAAGLAGLAVAAIGIAHQLLPRQFTPRQQSQIATWEMERRWRALPAGKIFPLVVSYRLSADSLDASASLDLDARRLGIASPTGCASAVSASAVSVLTHYRCSEALRATYVDSSGSMVATVAVMVLPAAAAATTVAADLSRQSSGSALLVRALSVQRTPAAGFRDAERQLTLAAADGPYVVLSTVGFADGRHRITVRDDGYLDQEMTSLDAGLTASATSTLGPTPRTPVCPGAPGC